MIDLRLDLWFGFFFALSMCRDVDIIVVSGGHLAPPDCKLQGVGW